MGEKYSWQYYTEDGDSKGVTDPRKSAIVWNAKVLDMVTEPLFNGDIDDYRLARIREDTSDGKEYNPKCILVTHERGEPAFIACNGKLFSIDTLKPYKTKYEQNGEEIAQLERKIRILKGEESEDDAGLGKLFGSITHP